MANFRVFPWKYVHSIILFAKYLNSLWLAHIPLLVARFTGWNRKPIPFDVDNRHRENLIDVRVYNYPLSMSPGTVLKLPAMF
jgi:hypothetical protein